LSQGDIERVPDAALLLVRVENGHTVPSLETLAKIAEAMDISLADFFPGTETAARQRDAEMLASFRRRNSLSGRDQTATARRFPMATSGWCWR